MHIFENKSKLILSYVIITFGIAVYTFAWAAFMLPAEIVGGGVSGISSVLHYAAGLDKIPIGVINFIINTILVLIGFKVLGSKFGANTIFGIILSSAFFILWQEVLHVERLFAVDEFGGFMCAIIGGACPGIRATAYRNAGNTDSASR